MKQTTKKVQKELLLVEPECSCWILFFAHIMHVKFSRCNVKMTQIPRWHLPAEININSAPLKEATIMPLARSRR